MVIDLNKASRHHFSFTPVAGIIFMMGLLHNRLVTAPLRWAIVLLWVLVGFAIYRIFTYRKEVQLYSPVVTSEGILDRKDLGCFKE
jgi:APA family basic amino acid/polyamine antiporter